MAQALDARATVAVHFDSVGDAQAVEAALRPDMAHDVPGARATLAREGAELSLRIEAEDAGALRAALNAYLRWIRVGLDLHRAAGP